MPDHLFTLTATDCAARIRAGSLSPVTLVEACLARIERLDRDIRAWVTVDAPGALAAARILETDRKSGKLRGPLHGVPLGVKDIFHVQGMVTTAGAGAFAHVCPSTDADAVARLRGAGAIILGKTATTEFAYADPPATRNPWNHEHTPGGSSSGSAAAVAARMVPLALGSQTAGSTLRPAAYCGIVGLKPTYGRISTNSIVPLACSLDHVGILARTVEDVGMAFSVLADIGARRASVPAVSSSDRTVVRDRFLPRLGVPWKMIRRHASPDIVTHVEQVAAILARAGAEVVEVEVPPSTEDVIDAGETIKQAEAAAFHAKWFAAYSGSYRARIRDLVEKGLRLSAVDYVRAQQARHEFKVEIGAVLEQFDAILSAAAPTVAPYGLESTGSPVLCAPWTSAGVPSIALPSGVNSDGLPLAIQLVGRAFADDQLLNVARWCERVLNFSEQPPV